MESVFRPNHCRFSDYVIQPLSWSYGQARPTVNEYSWTNLSSVLWVEQPIGTGFSQGTPNIENEDQLAEQLVGFMQQFLEVFSELKGKKLWLSGESVSSLEFLFRGMSNLCIVFL